MNNLKEKTAWERVKPFIPILAVLLTAFSLLVVVLSIGATKITNAAHMESAVIANTKAGEQRDTKLAYFQTKLTQVEIDYKDKMAAIVDYVNSRDNAIATETEAEYQTALSMHANTDMQLFNATNTTITAQLREIGNDINNLQGRMNSMEQGIASINAIMKAREKGSLNYLEQKKFDSIFNAAKQSINREYGAQFKCTN